MGNIRDDRVGPERHGHARHGGGFAHVIFVGDDEDGIALLHSKAGLNDQPSSLDE